TNKSRASLHSFGANLATRPTRSLPNWLNKFATRKKLAKPHGPPTNSRNFPKRSSQSESEPTAAGSSVWRAVSTHWAKNRRMKFVEVHQAATNFYRLLAEVEENKETIDE